MKYVHWVLVGIYALLIFLGSLLQAQWLQPSKSQPPLVLLYNHIVEDNRQFTQFAQRYQYVTQDQFLNQLALLSKRGYIFLPFEDIATYSGSKPVVSLIFSNAYTDVYQNAIPVLNAQGIPATLYADRDVIDTPGFMTTEQLSSLKQSGIVITNPNTGLLTDRQQRTEVSGVITNSQFIELLPPKKYNSLLYAAIFGMVALAIAGASLLFPAKVLLIPLVMLPTYVIRFGFFGVPVTLFELVLISSGIGTVLLYGKEVFAYMSKWPYLWPTMLFVLAAFLSTVFADTKSFALGGLKALIIEPIMFSMILAYWLNRDKLKPLMIISSILVSGSVVALIALYHYYSSDTYVDYNLIKLTTFFGNPNYLASFLSISLLFGVCLLVFRKQNRLLVGVATLVIGWCFYLTRSDSAYLGFVSAVGLLLVMFAERRLSFNFPARKVYCMVAIAVSFLLFLYVGSNMSYNFLSQNNLGSLLSRHFIYQTAVMIITSNPLWGVGLLNFHQVFVATVPLNTYEIDIALAHNTLLDFWSQMGILGLLAYVWLVIRFFSRTMATNEWVGKSVLIGMVAIIIHGMLDSQYHKNDYSMLFWVLLALATLPDRNSADKTNTL